MSLAGYWDKRYRSGGDSGAGSRGAEALAKAAYLKSLIAREQVTSIIDWGCGDGKVLGMVATMLPYLGVDVSSYIVGQLRRDFPEHSFITADNYRGQQADLSLSIDVLFHQITDEDHGVHLHRLFGSAERLVLIRATDFDGGQTARHVYRRRFTPDVERWFPDWSVAVSPQRSETLGWYLYRRVGSRP